MKNIWLWLALLLSVQSESQNLVAVEYFFDDDPGHGNATSISVSPADSLIVSTSIPTSSLSSGFHKLCVRAMNEDGVWSLFENRTFYIQGSGTDTSSPLVEAEYFYDSDPGLGNGIPLSSTTGDSLIVDQEVPTTGLGSGFHKLMVRAKNQVGKWSLYEARTIYIQPEVNPLPVQLDYAEYFYDDDPGVGNATSFGVSPEDSLMIDTNVPTTGLGGGFHHLFVRTKSTEGKWSLYEGRMVYIHVPNDPDNQTLVAAEYFYDVDPGVGNASPFTVTPDDSLSFNAAQDISALDEGFHHLFVRVENSDGHWSLYEGRTFFVQQPVLDTLTLVAAEYYFDVEPGIGLGSLLDVIPGDSIDANFTVPQSLAIGAHTMFLRVQASNGEWSLFEARTFDVSTVGVDELSGSGNELFQNFPNPFNQSTQVEFFLSRPEDVVIEVLDISGKLIQVIPLKTMNSGQHKLIIDAGDLSEGSYCYRMITPSFTETRQMLLLK